MLWILPKFSLPLLYINSGSLHIFYFANILHLSLLCACMLVFHWPHIISHGCPPPPPPTHTQSLPYAPSDPHPVLSFTSTLSPCSLFLPISLGLLLRQHSAVVAPCCLVTMETVSARGLTIRSKATRSVRGKFVNLPGYKGRFCEERKGRSRLICAFRRAS